MDWKHIKEINSDKIRILEEIWNKFSSEIQALSEFDINHLTVNSDLYQKINNSYPDIFPGGGGELKFYIKNYRTDWYLKRLFCPTCGKPIKWKKSKAYPGACSISCAASNPEVQAKKEATERKLNNGLRYIETEDFKQKQIQGLMKKYSVDTVEEAYSLHGKYMYEVNKNNPNYINPMKIEDIKNRSLETRKKLRPSDPTNHEKARKTNYLRYGDEEYGMTRRREVFKEKNPGVRSPYELLEVRKKIIQTNLNNFGRENYFSGSVGNELAKQAQYSKYDGRLAIQQHLTNFELLNKDYVIKNFIKDGYFLFEEFLEFYNLSISSARDYKNKFGIIIPSKNRRCLMQNELYECLRPHFEDLVVNTRTVLPLGKELDIYCQSKKFAIEFECLYYHSISTPEEDTEEYKYRHLWKTDACEDLDIQLYHITEDEWVNKHTREMWINYLVTKYTSTSFQKVDRLSIVDSSDETRYPLLTNKNETLLSKKIIYYNEYVGEFKYTIIKNNGILIVDFIVSPVFELNNVISYVNSILRNTYKSIQICLDRRLYSKLGLSSYRISDVNSYKILKGTKYLLSENEIVDFNSFRKMYDCGSIIIDS